MDLEEIEESVRKSKYYHYASVLKKENGTYSFPLDVGRLFIVGGKLCFEREDNDRRIFIPLNIIENVRLRDQRFVKLDDWY